MMKASDLAILASVFTAAGFMVLVFVGITVVPALDDAAVAIEREYPGTFLGDDAGPACVAVGGPKYTGGFAGRGADRYIVCGE